MRNISITCNNVEGAKDFVCMPYKYILPKGKIDAAEEEARKADLILEMNSDYPQNYVNAISENMNRCDYLVIPSDARVLAGLKDKNVPYIDYIQLKLNRIGSATMREEILLNNPQLYKTPIVRNGRLATVGYQPEVWKEWE